MDNSVSLAQRLSELRETAELTATELAMKSGVSLPYLSQLESGKRINPRLPIRRALAGALGVRPADLPVSAANTDAEQ
jgi:transcriptional regulator with XRE-family HTH domain